MMLKCYGNFRKVSKEIPLAIFVQERPIQLVKFCNLSLIIHIIQVTKYKYFFFQVLAFGKYFLNFYKI